MSGAHLAALERVSRIRGVRAVLVVSETDGFVVAESVMDGVDGRAVAALGASLAGRLRRTAEGADLARPSFVQLRAERGIVLAVPGGPELLLIALMERHADVGLARLELAGAARRVA